ncbi:MAG: hypothetical protein PHQ42_01540 [Patescibacteria group bacterium]|nr:hypothetical protein [Patescibacteria group bacterium]
MGEVYLKNRSGKKFEDPISGQCIREDTPSSRVIKVITESDGNGGGEGFLLARESFIGIMEEALKTPVRNGDRTPTFNLHGCLEANPNNPMIREIAGKLGMKLPQLAEH